MGWWSDLFGKSENVEKALDAVINTGDALFYTDEEKAESAQKRLNFALEWLKTSSPQNLARRYIAIIFVIYFILFVTFTAFAQIFYPAAGKVLYVIIKEFLFVPFSGIMTFYFMTHLLRGARK